MQVKHSAKTLQVTQELLHGRIQSVEDVLQVPQTVLSHGLHTFPSTKKPSTQVTQFPLVLQVKQSELQANIQVVASV